ncbi:glucose-6-phosphate isomerase [Candidatus Saccharibacteria bacterium]|nr:glucose-6-phosphate isomerase [Candidatus Saccharibacteria bacterium]
MTMKLIEKYVGGFVSGREMEEIRGEVEEATREVLEGTGEGKEFLGWVRLPESYDREEFERIKAAAEKIRGDSDVLVVIGIGGSYLGARAVIEALQGQNRNTKVASADDTSGRVLQGASPSLTRSKASSAPLEIYFAGKDISSLELNSLLEICGGKDVSVNVVSKSGTTTEPAIAFRVFRELLEKKYGKEGAAKRIYATTDRAKGALKQLADAEGYETFVVPDDVGGRYSVLTAVGILPIAVAGIDVDELIAGAGQAMEEFSEVDFEKNLAMRYAGYRNILYRKGFSVEVLAGYEPRMAMMSEWWKQLFGESEGKEGKGIFPASVVFSTDLHSMGQYIQEGERKLFETVLSFEDAGVEVLVPECDGDLDGLGYLEGKSLEFVNERAMRATILAHVDGGVPNVVLEMDRLREFELGYLIYFFMMSCAISGYVLGVNPFDQPGVESYKKNMFALLGKPGFEELRGELEGRL